MKNVLSMSDEDLMNLDPSTLPEDTPVEDTATEVQDADATTDAVEDADASEDSIEVSALAAEDSIEDAKADDAEDAAETEKTDTTDSAPKAEDAAKAESVDKQTDAPVDTVDYKAEYSRLLAPFKANGKDIAVNTVDDAIALMQMGANYNKKMAALKPNLKLMKMLENHKLLSEGKISYLIDLDKKDPSAISKLMKDSGIDPMDLAADTAGEYRPNSYTVEDKEIELDTVLDSIQDTPTYNRTLDILGTKWDGASKQAIATTPTLVKVINDHVQSGVYDIIAKEMESERMFGRLDGLSDIDAYRKVGDAIHARGGFNHLASPGNKTTSAPVVVAPKPKTADEDKLRDKKRAASPSNVTAPIKTTKDYNPLSMSDDAFTKLIDARYL